ncbi:hypothetical protein HanPI659440_Chr03g0126131 [Helianthus annuus]|nr:hypothetical protein HanPI659440_Chr03g0126131 [Helianthus annuus]
MALVDWIVGVMESITSDSTPSPLMVVFTGVCLLGSFSSIRQLVLDASKFKLFSDDVVD